MTQIPENHIKACNIETLRTQQKFSLRIMGKPVLLQQNSSGEISATEMSCKHQGADLTRGKWKGTCVTCPRHGWTYDLTTGQRINGDSPPLRRHAVVVIGDTVYVSLVPG